MYQPTEEELKPLLKFSRSHAMRIYNRLTPRAPIDDLESAAMGGILTALRKFDPTRGCSLKTFAVKDIRWAVGEYIREQYYRQRGTTKGPKIIPLKAFCQIAYIKDQHQYDGEHEYAAGSYEKNLSYRENFDKIEIQKRLAKLNEKERTLILDFLSGEMVKDIATKNRCSIKKVNSVIERISGTPHISYRKGR